MEKLNVNIDNSAPELVLRSGDAMPVVPPKKYKFTGDLDAVRRYLQGRRCADCTIQSDPSKLVQDVRAHEAVIEVCRKEMSITLYSDPTHEYAAVIQGRLELSDELQLFKINSNATFNREQLVKLIRYNKIHFANKDLHAEVLAAFQRFSAQAAVDMNASSDTRGNRAASFNKQVSTNLPTMFALELPLFKGQPPTLFMVEICIETTDGGAAFWLESVELAELIETQSKALLEHEINEIGTFCPVLFK